MATTKSTRAASKSSRYNELKTMLEERRRELLSEVQGKIRDVRAEGGKEAALLDLLRRNPDEVRVYGLNACLAVFNSRPDDLRKVYLTQARLGALPFAVRCKDCEEARETAEQRERMLARKSGSAALFFDMSN